MNINNVNVPVYMVYKPIGINGLIDFHHNHNPSLESHFASGDSPLLYNESNTFLKFDSQFNTLGTAEFGGHIQIKILSVPSNEFQSNTSEDTDNKNLNCDQKSSPNQEKRRGRPSKPIKVNPEDFNLHKLPIKKRIYKQLRLRNNESCRKTRRKLRGELMALVEECNSLESTNKRLKEKYAVLEQLQKEVMKTMMSI